MGARDLLRTAAFVDARALRAIGRPGGRRTDPRLRRKGRQRDRALGCVRGPAAGLGRRARARRDRRARRLRRDEPRDQRRPQRDDLGGPALPHPRARVPAGVPLGERRPAGAGRSGQRLRSGQIGGRAGGAAVAADRSLRARAARGRWRVLPAQRAALPRRRRTRGAGRSTRRRPAVPRRDRARRERRRDLRSPRQGRAGAAERRRRRHGPGRRARPREHCRRSRAGGARRARSLGRRADRRLALRGGAPPRDRAAPQLEVRPAALRGACRAGDSRGCPGRRASDPSAAYAFASPARRS